MQLGAVFPTHDVGRDRFAIRDFAQGVEHLGFDHLVVYDHVLGAVHEDRSLSGPYDETDEFHEPLVLLAHLAAITDRIELVPGVVVAPQRQTVLLAKQAAEVQILSGGRLRLALGTGWNWVEYEALGVDFERRGEILDEQVGLLRELWAAEVVSFRGHHHSVDRAGIAPLPEPTVPIWFGGYGRVALTRSADVGDGHLFGHLRDSTVAGARFVRERRAADGRCGPYGLDVIVDVVVDEARWIADMSTWRTIGGSHLTARTLRTAGVPDRGFRTVDQHLEALERWIGVVGPAVGSDRFRSRPSPA